VPIGILYYYFIIIAIAYYKRRTLMLVFTVYYTLLVLIDHEYNRLYYRLLNVNWLIEWNISIYFWSSPRFRYIYT